MPLATDALEESQPVFWESPEFEGLGERHGEGLKNKQNLPVSGSPLDNNLGRLAVV